LHKLHGKARMGSGIEQEGSGVCICVYWARCIKSSSTQQIAL